MSKYTLVKEDSIEIYGATLYRIKRISDGVSGGYIQSEKNLSHYGDAWISDNAQVYGNARVYGNAQVYGDARVYGNARVYGDAWVYGNAWISGDARVDSASAIIVLCIAQKYDVTITRKYIFIGCQVFKREDIKKITKDKAVKLNLPKELYSGYKEMILGAMKLVKEKPNAR